MMLPPTFVPLSLEKLVQLQVNMDNIVGDNTFKKNFTPFKKFEDSFRRSKTSWDHCTTSCIKWFDASCTDPHTKNKFLLLSFP